MKIIFTILIFFCKITFSQEYFPVNKGIKTSKNNTIAFINAKIYKTPSKIIDNGILLIRDGKVIDIGSSVYIPKGTKKINLNGKTIYPSFIDVYSTFGISKINIANKKNNLPQYDATRKGYYWNDHIRPDMDAYNKFKFDFKKAKELLKIGFGTVNTHINDGIMQGNGILVALNTNSNNSYNVLNKNSCNYLSFKKSKQSFQEYPTSQMGAIALIRQAYLDANWYANGNAKNTDLALEAINKKKNLPQIFSTDNYLEVLRANKLGNEFGIRYTILGSGDEYKRVKDIGNTNATLIIPVNFRKVYDVSNSNLSKKISLSDMRAWNQEPSNPAVLNKNGVPFALTTYKLKSLSNFLKNIRKAIKYGFNKTTALKSLTTIPSQILKNDKIGNLKKGSYANFLITSGDIFNDKTILFENWVLGNKNTINSMINSNLNGNYTLNLNGKKYDLNIKDSGISKKVDITLNNKKIKSKFSLKNNWINFTINDSNKFWRLNGKINSKNNQLNGTAIDSYGKETKWKAILKSKNINKKDSIKKPVLTNEIVKVTYPNTSFGNYIIPQRESIIIKNATIWTSEQENPVINNADILIINGKIKKIGKNLPAKNIKTIDGTGKFVTAGIIDEHSHIATSFVNEFGQNSSAEVSIEDVIDPDNINIYRNLAGGVTTIQILHGSANPIGGQSAIIKLKWGENANNLIYKNSPKFIKFALGENVKQSNWGDNNIVRFPQTRMGVEQVYMDYFQRAKEYGEKKKTNNYRKDIELETLLEILDKKRFITCHSYIQSEINMLMKVAEKFNFKINTFTHILEGYKVADKMRKHGVGGSTFSDWWAYKYEVKDAIPYNAAIMHNQGIITAINSDDAEMSRRLNQEAAKTIKYGDVSEQEAWKMVTINPAKLLHISDRTGSLKVGKDADIVIWSGNPLSIYSKPLTTIVDGAVYFDIKKDKQKRVQIKKEKAKLIDMMLKEKLNGAETQIPKNKIQKHFHCDTK